MSRSYEITKETDIDEMSNQWAPDSADTPPDVEPNCNAPKIRSIADLPSIRTYAAQKIDYIVEGILAAGTITMISGDSGCGKTTFATALASSIERGAPFAGLQTQRRPVLVLDRENPLSVVLERLDRLGIDVSENFKIWGGWVEQEAPHPGSAVVVEWVMGCTPKPVIIVDSFIAFFDGDENSSSEVRPFMHFLRRLADLGATILVLHHSGKGETSKEYRGSSDIKASVDVGYKLMNLGDVSTLTTLRLTAFKARFTVEPETIFHYRDGEFVLDTRPTMRTNEELLQQLLIENPRIRTGDFESLAGPKGVSRSRARRFLQDGVAKGTIRRDPGERNAGLHTWVDCENETERDA